MPRLLQVFLGVVLALLLGTLGGGAQAYSLVVNQAVLVTETGEQQVNLPHRLAASDFRADGSVVTYRLTFDLANKPEGLQAIYIAKLSLSGRLLSGGQLIWECGRGDLSQLRCLRQPHLIRLPAGFLTAGRNTFDLQIFADAHQTNGLTPIVVGPYDQVFEDHYQIARFLKVDLLRLLGILAGVAGLLSLAAGIVAPHQRIFFAFAATAILEAMAVFLMSAVAPPGDKALASWLIFNVRFVGVVLKLLLLYEAFGRLRLRDPLVMVFLILIAVAPVALWVTGSNLWVLMGFYTVLGLGMTATVIRLLRWTIEDPRPQMVIWTATAIVIYAASLHDYLRLGGAATFDGVYLLYYVFPLSMIIIGSILFAQMGKGLRVAQTYAQSLTQEVAERTSALESALASIRNMEASALNLTRNIPFGTFILQTWGPQKLRYAFFSDRLRQMINLPDDVAPPLMHASMDMIHPDDVASTRAVLVAAIDAGTRLETEFRIRSAEGGWRWLRCIVLPQPGTASPVVWDGVVIDVTEARAAEERLRIANAGLVQAAAEQSRTEERERLLQEMHDGFGSQLSSARLAIEQSALTPDEVAVILRECSDDLRIVVDTLGNSDGDLINTMADYRYRTERRMVGTGITLAWDIAIPEDARLPPTQILHILRVLQEAKNNALRHSGARHLKVTLRVADGRLEASVADDGKGFDSTAREGRGMANMRKRSREIGAQLKVTGGADGTTVTLTMDLPDAR